MEGVGQASLNNRLPSSVRELDEPADHGGVRRLPDQVHSATQVLRCDHCLIKRSVRGDKR